MGVSIFVYGPVAVLGILALLAALGMGDVSGTFGAIDFNSASDATHDYFYDYNGRAIAFSSNYTVVVAEHGTIYDIASLNQCFWENSTGSYPLYTDTSHTNPARLETSGFIGYHEAGSTSGGFTSSLSTTLGLIAVIAGVMAVGVIASVKFFGFGLSDVGINTLMKGSAYILIWAIFTGLAMSLIVGAGDLFTPIIYLALTGVYAFGVMGEIGTPSQG